MAGSSEPAEIRATRQDDRVVGSNEVQNEEDASPKAQLPEGNVSKARDTQNGEIKEQKASKLKSIWSKIGLDIPTLLLMFKGSVAPTIAIAFYQADSVSVLYGNLGYLVAIICVLSVPIMPRAKFIQTVVLNTIGVCIGCAIGLLGIWSGIQARIHTTPAGSTARYNSSQAVVCAIWLFANIWFVNVLRAKMPALQFPVIIYSIFTNISFTFGPRFPAMSYGIALIKQILYGFLSAFGISTCVNLLVIPMSSRLVVFKQQAGYIGLLRATLKAQTGYLQSLENTDMFLGSNGENETKDNPEDGNKPLKKDTGKQMHPANSPHSKALKGAIAGLTALHGKLHGDIPFAKREIAWGKLDAKDIDEIYSLFRGITIPLLGMSTISDIFERVAERRGWIKPRKAEERDRSEAWEHCPKAERIAEQKVWNGVMKALHDPFSVVVAAMDQGLEHAGIVLELLPKPKKSKAVDEEAQSEPKPGDPDFAKYLGEKVKSFYSTRGQVLRAWAKEKGLSESQFDAAKTAPVERNEFTPDEAKHRRDQQQLYLILFMENLLFSAGTAIEALVDFADKKAEDGTMKKKRLIVPGPKRLRKWVKSIGGEDTSIDTESPDSLEAGSNNVYLGQGFNPRKDPEHLPANSPWQRFGNLVRTIPRFLGSTESAFGFRVACATLTIGIVAFLKDTETFFFQQRLVWAMIIIAIGMTMTSGQSIFGFLGRVGGTAIAMVISMLLWYIVDEQVPGVIVMLWFFIFIQMYFFIKYPRLIQVWLLSIVTEVLIVGYELQVKKIGIAASASTGQPYYPIYELAPYRLATVAAGSFVAFIWTIFPYPISDRSWIRKDLGSTLYLLANYYSVVDSTVNARLHNTEGDMERKTSPGRQLKKVRTKIFNKLMMLLPSLQQHADWQKWEPTIGGKFPRATYEGIILRANNLTNYLALISYATESWSIDADDRYPNTTPASRRAWLNDLTALVDQIGPTSSRITSLLSLLSASVRQGSALPPHIPLPQPYNLSRRLEALDKGILDFRHIEEPGYSAYAVMQVASSLITDDLARLVDHVKDLVGENDFTFHVNLSDSSLESEISRKGKKD
ncbi:hypothetical protein B0O99DRAFT_564613 [Bisporella sp. PMI_857]|nr:hypothetical protein B0O99DRAFT_564613 [Bisporella sp. PMI_857]